VLTVPAGRLNFLLQPKHLRLVADMVRDKLGGKSVVRFEDAAL